MPAQGFRDVVGVAVPVEGFLLFEALIPIPIVIIYCCSRVGNNTWEKQETVARMTYMGERMRKDERALTRGNKKHTPYVDRGLVDVISCDSFHPDLT